MAKQEKVSLTNKNKALRQEIKELKDQIKELSKKPEEKKGTCVKFSQKKNFG